jgi:hypothetical protein
MPRDQRLCDSIVAILRRVKKPLRLPEIEAVLTLGGEIKADTFDVRDAVSGLVADGVVAFVQPGYLVSLVEKGDPPPDVARPRFFIRNPNGETCWAYCGDVTDRDALTKAVGDFVVNDAEGVLTQFTNVSMEFEVKMRVMTDAEVAAIPEM